MIYNLKTEIIVGKKCHIYRSKRDCVMLPIFYWGIDNRDKNAVMTVVSCLEEYALASDFLIVAYEVENWNDDFSPWKADAVFGTENFGGNASDTSGWLSKYCMPFIESSENGYINNTEMLFRFPVGYSLSGLFSLWVYFTNGILNTGIFKGAVSCSGSLWFDGWLEYVRLHEKYLDSTDRKFIYLSLGDKEEKTKNPRIASVGDNTKAFYEIIMQHKYTGNIISVFEWNAGGHFSEPYIRLAKGIRWIVENLGKY